MARAFDFVAEADRRRALAHLSSVRAAFEALADHPRLGRVAEDSRRKLVLSRGKHGYIAKYRWLAPEDVVLILAVRHQHEAGCTHRRAVAASQAPISDDALAAVLNWLLRGTDVAKSRARVLADPVWMRREPWRER